MLPMDMSQGRTTWNMNMSLRFEWSTYDIMHFFETTKTSHVVRTQASKTYSRKYEYHIVLWRKMSATCVYIFVLSDNHNFLLSFKLINVINYNIPSEN